MLAHSCLIGQRLPLVRLHSADGNALRLTTYRGRSSLALYLLPAADEATRDLLRAIAHHLPDYAERHAQPIAVLGTPLAAARALQAELALSFPLTIDPTGRLIAAAGDHSRAFVLLTDRYAEVRVHLTDSEVILPEHQPEILDWLLYLDCLCSC